MLVAYVHHETALRRPNEDGSSRIAGLEASAKHGNKDAIAALTPPEFPDALSYLYDAFYAVSAGRGEGMNGPAALSYPDVESWSRLTTQSLEAHEIEALFTVDRAFRAALREPEDE